MQTSPPTVDADQFKQLIVNRQLLAEAVENMKVRLLEIEHALAALRVAEVVERTRVRQADDLWLQRLGEQYSDQVCQETLEVNRLFPVAGE